MIRKTHPLWYMHWSERSLSKYFDFILNHTPPLQIFYSRCFLYDFIITVASNNKQLIGIVSFLFVTSQSKLELRNVLLTAFLTFNQQKWIFSFSPLLNFQRSIICAKCSRIKVISQQLNKSKNILEELQISPLSKHTITWENTLKKDGYWTVYKSCFSRWHCCIFLDSRKQLKAWTKWIWVKISFSKKE